ncbi:MAG: STAS-like domain-containing protein [Rhodospirillales bacterium]|nr:STAS-like domain-containing protein [Rhodospirillales bacterium]
MKQISIAEDFSRTPAGRYRTDGPKSGEDFRERLLVPALRDHKQVRVQLDGVEGYGSSFLEEAFGGLVRISGFDAQHLNGALEIQTSDAGWKEEVWEYIREASCRAQ